MAEAWWMATAAAVRAAAEFVQWAWIANTEASSLSTREQELYVAGLQTPRSLAHPVGGDPLRAIIANVAPQAPRLEYGFAAYHLPERIDWAGTPGARRSKRGIFYLFVPFRHFALRSQAQRPKGMPASRAVMTQAVYRVAKGLQRGQYLTAGPTQGSAVHAPGLRPYVPRFARNVRPGYNHAAVQERLVRRPGRGRGSTYMTFRTLRQDSPGWWIPGKPGVHLARQTAQDTAPAVRAMIEAGIRQDIEAALRGQRGS